MSVFSVDCVAAVLLIVTMSANLIAADPSTMCKIVVTEKGTDWPVSLIELRTVNEIRFVTDNAGIIAFDLPELMGQEVWFGIHGHGYEVKPDYFGYRGVRMTPQPGQTLKVEVERINIARRIGRLTGSGLFAESQKLGLHTDWQDGPIVGCDSVLNAVYQGKLFWAWGDTNLAKYPLGIFDTSSATTSLKPLRSFEPPLKMPFDYFVDVEGRPRGVAKIPGEGPTWLWAYVSLTDKDGKAKLVATYSKIKPPLDTYESGLCVWNDQTQKFDTLKKVWTKTDEQSQRPTVPDGHPALWKDAGGKEWVLFGNPFPKLRCPATFESWQDPSKWETLEAPANLVSAEDGKPVVPHTGSLAWSGYRKRWVTVFMEKFGKPSVFGELWYAEAKSPLDPWGPATKILTHDNYTFYNPRLHAELTPNNSPILLFEGTYTREFADRPQPTPRYNYNQILYRLDLNDPSLAPSQN